jgi:hypothetical protein
MFLHVLDSQENPISGASVHIANFNDAGLGESFDGLTDESGSLAIPEPRDSSNRKVMNVFVSHEGYVPKSASFTGKESLSEFGMKMEAGIPIGGWVVDELDRPVGGVQIAIGNMNQMESFKKRENVDFQTVNIVKLALPDYSQGFDTCFIDAQQGWFCPYSHSFAACENRPRRSCSGD